ncbi:MAG: hypothetical protein JXP34_28690 [Planctomycetes bacterium]|nr:hypothetical protein [Planctomycetota bacterium]
MDATRRNPKGRDGKRRMRTALAGIAILGTIALAPHPKALAVCSQASRSGSHTFSAGNSNAGVKGTFGGDAQYRSTDCSGGGLAKGGVSGTVDVLIFGKTIRALTVTAQASAAGSPSSYSSNASLTIKVGPFTLVSKSDPHYLGWSKTYPITLAKASYSMMVGPVPITIEASIGVGLEGTIELRPDYPVQVSASLAGWANGTAGGYVSGAVLRAGVKAILDLLKTTLASNTYLYMGSARGSVKVIFEPARIRIRAVAERRSCSVSGWSIKCSWKEIAGVTLVDASAASYTKTLFTF